MWHFLQWHFQDKMSTRYHLIKLKWWGAFGGCQQWLIYAQSLMDQIVRHPEIAEIIFLLSVTIICLINKNNMSNFSSRSKEGKRRDNNTGWVTNFFHWCCVCRPASFCWTLCSLLSGQCQCTKENPLFHLWISNLDCIEIITFYSVCDLSILPSAPAAQFGQELSGLRL